MNQIGTAVSQISGRVSKISESTQVQSTNLNEINQAVKQLDQSTQQNAARLEEATTDSEVLINNATALLAAVSDFTLVESMSAKGGPAEPSLRRSITGPAEVKQCRAAS